MIRTLFHGFVAAALVLGAGTVHAQATPVGVWKTIDDESKKEKSLIRITESGGVLSGKLEKLLDPATAPDAVCKECSDERKDKPVLGMTLIRNVRQNDGDKSIWDFAVIRSPEEPAYECLMEPFKGN